MDFSHIFLVFCIMILAEEGILALNKKQCKRVALEAQKRLIRNAVEKGESECDMLENSDGIMATCENIINEKDNCTIYEEPEDEGSCAPPTRPNFCQICGQHQEALIAPNIIGGSTAPRSKYPSNVIIRVKHSDSSTTFGYNGVLISDRHVLTIGNAVKESVSSTVEYIRVDLGKSEYSNDQDKTVTVYAKNFTLHPNYNGLQENNLAIIEIMKIELSETIIPICLPAKDSGDFADQEVATAGYGITALDATSFSATLQEANLTILADGICGIDKPDKGSACVQGTAGIGHCNGDEGTPIYIKQEQNGTMKDVVVGLAVGKGGGDCGTVPYLFTRISFFLNWIEENVDDDVVCV